MEACTQPLLSTHAPTGSRTGAKQMGPRRSGDGARRTAAAPTGAHGRGFIKAGVGAGLSAGLPVSDFGFRA